MRGRDGEFSERAGATGWIAACALPGLLLFSLSAAPAFADSVRSRLKAFEKEWKSGAVKEPFERGQKLRKLAEIDDGDAVRLVLELGLDEDESFEVHDVAIDVLRQFKGKAARTWLIQKGPKLRDERHRAALAGVYATLSTDEAVAGLLPLLEDRDEGVVLAALDESGKVRDRRLVDAVVKRLADQTGVMRAACVDALAGMTGKFDLKTPDEWKTWWEARRDSFDFSKVPQRRRGTRERSTRGKLSTTTDGSAIYESIISENVVFIVDVSGSMEIKVEDDKGRSMSRLDYVRRELKAAIETQLGDSARFNILVFSDTVKGWKPRLGKASSSARKSAGRFLDRLKPGGGTNVYNALEKAFSDKKVDTIYLLTDGHPTVGDVVVPTQIRGKVRAWNRGRNVRIHTVAFLTGKDPDVIEDTSGAKLFMRNIARDNNGSFRAME